MSNATLDSIEAAVFAALVPLKRTASTPDAFFEELDRYAGELTAEGAAEGLLNRAPVALLAFEGELSDEASEATTTAGESYDVGRSGWRVYVVVTDPRDDEMATVGIAGQPGALALCTLVRNTLNRLPIADTFGVAQLRYKGIQPVLIQRGRLYAYRVRFECLSVLDCADPPAVAVHTLDRIDGGLHLPDAPADTPPVDPIAVTRNDYP